MGGRSSAVTITALAALAALCAAGSACVPAPDRDREGATSPAAPERSDPSDAGDDSAAADGADAEDASTPDGRLDDGRPPEEDPFWRVTTVGEVWATPTIRDGVAYVGGDGGRLYAVDVESGSLRFAAGPRGAPLRSTPAVDAERVVLADGAGEVVALSVDGRNLWRRPLEAVGSVALEADGVFAATAGGDLVRLHAEDGREIWRLPLVAGGPPTAGPRAAAGRVVIATADGELHGVDAAGGDRRWRRSVGDGAAFRLAGGTVYASGGGFLWAIRGADGAERWRLWLSDFLAAPPAILGDIVVAAAGDGQVWGVDAADGRELWRRQLDGALRAPPAMASDVAFLGAGDHLFVA
ncbi:MAG: PQQ-binding-like beta-propeller repeat protein, partial [Acidobacteriota bacterium]